MYRKGNRLFVFSVGGDRLLSLLGAVSQRKRQENKLMSPTMTNNGLLHYSIYTTSSSTDRAWCNPAVRLDQNITRYFFSQSIQTILLRRPKMAVFFFWRGRGVLLADSRRQEADWRVGRRMAGPKLQTR